MVSDTENEYYLIDLKGNRIGDYTVKNVAVRDGGYELKNNDGKYAIADKKGDMVTEFKYNSVYYRSNAEPNNIWTGRNESEKDNSYDVIDLETGNVIAENVNVQIFYNNYFTVKNSDGKTEYYTYKGNLFYTSEK